jgi:hypothetical protein
MKEREQLRGRRAVVILSGQNIDSAWLQIALAGGTPQITSPSERSSISYSANHTDLESAQHVSPVATQLLALADESIE